MMKLVKLILTCQVKDDLIPQLIPLIWVSSIFMVLFILLKLINVYYYKRVDELGKVECVLRMNRIKIIW